jgi:hypothetical protein
VLIVADRRGLLGRVEPEEGVVAVLGGAGGDAGVTFSARGLTKADPPRESLLRRLVPRSVCASVATNEEGGWVNRVAMVALALLAWTATGSSLSCSSSSSKTVGPNLRKGNVLPVDGVLGGD